MARIASTTSAGTPIPGGGMTLDALMRRQRELAERQAALSAPSAGSATIAGGLGQMANALFTGIQQRQAAREEAEGRARLAQAMSGIDMSTGIATPEQMSTIYGLDPDLGVRVLESGIAGRRAQAEAALAAANRTEDRKWRVEDREDDQAATIEAAKARASIDASQPLTTQAKLKADFDAGRITQEAYDAGMKKASSPDFVMGDTTPAGLKKFDEGEKESWAKYLQQGNKAASMAQDMAVLEAVSEAAPSGGLPGAIANLYPQGTTAGAVFKSIIERLAPQMRAEGSGSTSDIEFEGFRRSLPNLRNDPAANRIIMDVFKAKGQIDLNRAKIVTQWRNGKLDEAAARQQLYDLDSTSILSPQARAIVDQYAPKDGATAPAADGTDMSKMTDAELAAEIARRKAAGEQ